MGSLFALKAASERPGWSWWVTVALVTAGVMALPSFYDLSFQYDTSQIFVMALLALSMSFLWGYVGILSLGQTAFFGLGGYVYAVMSMNTGDTSSALLAGILIPALFSALLGYFLIWGRISDIYFSVITLVVTLILEKAIRATSGEQFVVGDVRLNGQNGIPGVPGLEIPWEAPATLFIDGVFYLTAAVLMAVYIGLRLILTTRFGRVLVGLRENPRRVELLGYDSRRYQLGAFVLCGAIAGLAGVLFAVWGNFVGPSMFDLNQAAQVVIWVIVGGRMTLAGPILGTVLVVSLTAWLGTQGVGQVTLVLGAVLILFVLLFKNGLVPSISDALAAVESRLKAGSRP
ncbi:MAG: branched-chain amino acid ABC transporter permease [Pseudomonadota bacterium]